MIRQDPVRSKHGAPENHDDRGAVRCRAARWGARRVRLALSSLPTHTRLCSWSSAVHPQRLVFCEVVSRLDGTLLPLRKSSSLFFGVTFLHLGRRPLCNQGRLLLERELPPWCNQPRTVACGSSSGAVDQIVFSRIHTQHNGPPDESRLRVGAAKPERPALTGEHVRYLQPR